MSLLTIVNHGRYTWNSFFRQSQQQVIKICQPAYYELKRVSYIRRYPTEDAAKQLVTSCVLSRLDYCNSLLMGTPNSVIQPMQKVQNTAARLILKAPRHRNCTPLLQQLHWLPISERIIYKTACMCYNAITGSAPSYPSGPVCMGKGFATLWVNATQEVATLAVRIWFGSHAWVTEGPAGS